MTKPQLLTFSTKNENNQEQSCKKVHQASFLSHVSRSFPCVSHSTKIPPLASTLTSQSLPPRSPPLSKAYNIAKSQNNRNPPLSLTPWQSLASSPGSRISTGLLRANWYRKGTQCLTRGEPRGSSCNLRWLNRRVVRTSQRSRWIRRYQWWRW